MVYQWTHRKFKEQGNKRYLTVKLHEALADLFSGAKSRKDLPLKITLSSGEVRELPGNRRLPAQEPVLVRLAGDPMHYNERMLSELPHHLLMSSRYNDLLNLVLDPEVFEYYAQNRNQPVLAQIWRELIVSSIRASPRSEYTAMLDNLQPDIKQRKEAALARKVGEFLSTLMARMSDAKVFMQRSVQVSSNHTITTPCFASFSTLLIIYSSSTLLFIFLSLCSSFHSLTCASTTLTISLAILLCRSLKTWDFALKLRGAWTA